MFLSVLLFAHEWISFPRPERDLAVVQDNPRLFLQKDLPALMMASMGVQVYWRLSR